MKDPFGFWPKIFDPDIEVREDEILELVGIVLALEPLASKSNLIKWHKPWWWVRAVHARSGAVSLFRMWLQLRSMLSPGARGGYLSVYPDVWTAIAPAVGLSV